MWEGMGGEGEANRVTGLIRGRWQVNDGAGGVGWKQAGVEAQHGRSGAGALRSRGAAW